MNRKLLLLVPAVCLVIAIIYLVSGNIFNFFLWLFAFGILMLAFWPLMGTVVEEHIPMAQVFFSMIFFFILVSLVAYYDFMRVGLSLIESLGYGIVIGVAFLAIIMAIRGKK